MSSISQLERDTYVRLLGGNQPSKKYITQLKREYLTSIVGGSTTATMTIKWLRKLITDAGNSYRQIRFRLDHSSIISQRYSANKEPSTKQNVVIKKSIN